MSDIGETKTFNDSFLLRPHNLNEPAVHRGCSVDLNAPVGAK